MESPQVYERQVKEKKDGEKLHVKEVKVTGPEGELHHRFVTGEDGSRRFSMENTVLRLPNKGPRALPPANNQNACGFCVLLLIVTFFILVEYFSVWGSMLRVVFGIFIFFWIVGMCVIWNKKAVEFSVQTQAQSS